MNSGLACIRATWSEIIRVGLEYEKAMHDMEKLAKLRAGQLEGRDGDAGAVPDPRPVGLPSPTPNEEATMRLTLTRLAYMPFGTYGLLKLPDGHLLPTVEAPWQDNKPFVSCIPVGLYVLKFTIYHRGHYPALELTEVPDRTRILIHRGNLPTDVRGCIAVGWEWTAGVANKDGGPWNMWGVQESREAHQHLMNLWDDLAVSGKGTIRVQNDSDAKGHLPGQQVYTAGTEGNYDEEVV